MDVDGSCRASGDHKEVGLAEDTVEGVVLAVGAMVLETECKDACGGCIRRLRSGVHRVCVESEEPSVAWQRPYVMW